MVDPVVADGLRSGRMGDEVELEPIVDGQQVANQMLGVSSDPAGAAVEISGVDHHPGVGARDPVAGWLLETGKFHGVRCYIMERRQDKPQAVKKSFGWDLSDGFSVGTGCLPVEFGRGYPTEVWQPEVWQSVNTGPDRLD